MNQRFILAKHSFEGDNFRSCTNSGRKTRFKDPCKVNPKFLQIGIRAELDVSYTEKI